MHALLRLKWFSGEYVFLEASQRYARDNRANGRLQIISNVSQIMRRVRVTSAGRIFTVHWGVI